MREFDFLSFVKTTQLMDPSLAQPCRLLFIFQTYNIHIPQNALSTMDRTSLLNDAFSLADGGRLTYTTALDLTKYLGAERSHVAWSVMGSRLAYFHYVFYYTPGTQFNRSFDLFCWCFNGLP